MSRSFSKDVHERARLKAQARILEWVEQTKSAGITRLHDRYGEVFKRVEYKSIENNEIRLQMKNPTNNNQKGNLRPNKKIL